MGRMWTTSLIWGVALQIAPVAAGQSIGCAAAARLSGLSPEVLAASGLGLLGVQGALSRLHDAQVERAQLASALQQVSTLETQLATALATFQSDPTVSTVRTQVKSLRQQLQTARQGVIQAKQQVREVSLAGVQTACQLRIVAMLKSAAHQVPTEFRVASLTSPVWAKVSCALAVEQQALAQGDPVPPEASAVLNPVRADAAVVAAKTSVDTQLAGVLSAFASAPLP